MKHNKNLQSLLDHLVDLLFRTWSAFLVAKNLDSIIDKHDFPQSRYFFVSVYTSSIESTLLGFSKLLSHNKNEISILYLLDVCNRESSAFKNINQVDVSSLAHEHQRQLEQIKPLVEQTKKWRNKAIAHMDKKFVDDPSAIAQMEAVDMDAIGKSLILLQDIINVYREWFGLGSIRLKDAETKMTNEWEYLIELMKRDNL